MDRRFQQGCNPLRLQRGRYEDRWSQEGRGGFPRQNYGRDDGDRMSGADRGGEVPRSDAARQGGLSARGRSVGFRGGDDFNRAGKRRFDERGDPRILGEEDLRHKLVRDPDRSYRRQIQATPSTGMIMMLRSQTSLCATGVIKLDICAPTARTHRFTTIAKTWGICLLIALR